MASTRTLAAIAAGGALGGAARYLIEQALPAGRDAFPWATFVINVSGSLGAGAAARVRPGDMASDPVRAAVRRDRVPRRVHDLQHLDGGDRELVSHGRLALAAGYLAGSVLAGLAAVSLGLVLGRAVLTRRTRGPDAPAELPADRRARPEGADMRLQGPSQRLTIFIGETDHYHRKPLYSEIVRRAHTPGWPAPASSAASRGSARPAESTPPGSSACPRTFRWRSSSSTRRRTWRAFLPELDELITEGW